MSVKAFFLVLNVCFVFSCQSVRKDKASLHSDCIAHVMAVDDSLGKIRNRECETLPLSKAIANYSDGMHKINTDNCPEDFTKAFQSHIDAWNAIRVITDNYSERRGEMHLLFKGLEQSKDSIEFKKLQANIWSTWAEVEKFVKK